MNNKWTIVTSQKKSSNMNTINRFSNNNMDKIDDEQFNSDKKKQKRENFKKILCKNIINNQTCMYANKCLFAHKLSEQTVEPIRKIAYDMIKDNVDLSDV